jgi:hypothetical protein
MQMAATIDPTEYEKAFFEHLLYEFRPPLFEVIHDIKITGRYSQWPRQIDVAVRRAGEKHPFLVAEAKRHGRKVSIEYIDAFITKLQEVDTKIGVVVASSNFSKPSQRLAKAFGIDLFVMPIEQALEMNWRPVARDIFPMDWGFHPEIAAGIYRLQKGDPVESVLDVIENIPFDEWERLAQYALRYHQDEAMKFFGVIAYHHYDDAWRFNAIQQLMDFGLLNRLDISELLTKERDPDILALLESAGY